MRNFERVSGRAMVGAALVVLIAAGVAGCSSDATRFSDTTFSNPPPTPQAAPVGRVDAQPLSSNGQALPPPATATYHASRNPPGAGRDAASNWTADGGTEISVAPGETVATLSQRYGVSAAAILAVNHVPPSETIRAGQHLVIPRYQYASRPTRVAHAAHPPKPAHASASAVHVVHVGESLSSVAHRYHKSRSALAKANNIAPDAKIKVGQQLIIPGAQPARAAAKPAAPHPARAAAKPSSERIAAAPPLQRVATAEAGPAGAGSSAPAEPAEPAKTAGAEDTGSTAGFRWPVHGRIIAAFGTETNGQRNDGINLAVPEGTSIKAAEAGTVAYAGNELKGYGNLVLVRHANGFVTAYAHGNELLVKRGDQVKRGQIIARAGQTGNVSSPQLHFEIRKGATPVDPTRYLSGT
jgi:murein DD-endopeptidase MepM/ murein hydrolase activator NlpD